MRTPDPHPTAPRRHGRWRVILLLAIFAGALLFAINEISTQEPREEAPIALEGVGDAQRIFGGERQFGDRLGRAEAPVTVQFFTDMQCADCREQFMQTVPSLVETHVRTGEVQMHYRNYSFSRTAIQQGFIASEAAAEQGYLWQYAYIFFASQDEAERLGVNDDFLNAIAVSIPELEFHEWRQAFEAGGGEDGEFTERLLRQDELARGLGLRAQPSAVVSGPRGTEIVQDSPDLDQLVAAVEAVS